MLINICARNEASTKNDNWAEIALLHLVEIINTCLVGFPINSHLIKQLSSRIKSNLGEGIISPRLESDVLRSRMSLYVPMVNEVTNKRWLGFCWQEEGTCSDEFMITPLAPRHQTTATHNNEQVEYWRIVSQGLRKRVSKSIKQTYSRSSSLPKHIVSAPKPDLRNQCRRGGTMNYTSRSKVRK